jgi:DNA-binding NtrC family response regulator
VRASTVAPEAPLAAFLGGSYDASLDGLTRSFDRLIIEQALSHSGGNVTRAAQVLGMSRSRLRITLKALGKARDDG